MTSKASSEEDDISLEERGAFQLLASAYTYMSSSKERFIIAKAACDLLNHIRKSKLGLQFQQDWRVALMPRDRRSGTWWVESGPPIGEPTLTDKINTLPEWARQFIHDIETRCDPAGDVRTITELRDTIRALTAEQGKWQSDLLDGSGHPVIPEKQAAAVKAWAEYWGSACPDCGPQDYEAMLQHALIRNTR
jgi:hypothetical protein